MGSVGSAYSSFISAEYGIVYGHNPESPQAKFMVANSNIDEWERGLSIDEKTVINSYTGSKFTQMNDALYKVPYDEISPILKAKITDLSNAISKFELNKGIEVTRESSASLFGGNTTIADIKKFLQPTNGVVQINGFMSSAFTSDKGAAYNSDDIVVHYKVPASKGAGAYVDRISSNAGENEFLFNNNGVYKYDINSLRVINNKIHINAKWIGRAKKQAL